MTPAMSKDDNEPSRDQIAASLASRDPAWFRQTADRGLGNAAYRKSQEEATSGDDFASGRRGLPGLSRGGSAQSGKDSGSVSSQGRESRTGSGVGSTASSSAFANVRTSASSRGDLRSLIAADQEQEEASPMPSQTPSDPDAEQSGPGRSLTMSTSQARIANATERPASPTKGMGGFVQSAMMKRSDSVNKRWSAQPGSSLSRETSSASARSGYAGLTGSYSMPKLEPTPTSRESSNEPSSRPSSSSSNLTTAILTQGRDDNTTFVKPALPRSHSRSKSVASTYSTTAEEGHTSPPSSPSKRWSPSKSRSTWLESAIAKPESPKPAPAPRNSQPSWMADIAKAKAQRASGDGAPKPTDDTSSRPGSPTKASFGQGMLKRSESRDLGAPRIQTPNPVEIARSRASSPTKTNSAEVSVTRSPSTHARPEPDLSTQATKETVDTSDEALADVLEAEPSSRHNDDISESRDLPSEASLPVTGSPGKRNGLSAAPSASATPTIKSKPETPPKPQTDFRSTLRPRAPTASKQQETPEFLSRFGNLKKSQTQNYVAPDLLKDNILRGKSDLARTDGPVKTQRRDELKESLLAKKDRWRTEKEEGIVHERKISNPPKTPQKPEALTKRELLGRPESTKTPSSPEKPASATPEALARHRSLRNPGSDAPLLGLEKQRSAPASASSAVVSGMTPATETSKLAARFNPGLSNILARGPPAATHESNSQSHSSALPQASTITSTPRPSDPLRSAEQLQDMRKDRAKGPKRRKGIAAAPAPEESATTVIEIPAFNVPQEGIEVEKAKPRVVPGSAASLMVASLKKSEPSLMEQKVPQGSETLQDNASSTPSTPSHKPTVPAKFPAAPTPSQRTKAPVTPAKVTSIQGVPKPTGDNAIKPSSATVSNDVAEFAGFGSRKKSTPSMRLVEDDKENAGQLDNSPSVKSTASLWGRPSSPKKATAPAQIKLPSKKDEEAAMRSAGLLASSPNRPDSSHGSSTAVYRLDVGIEDASASSLVPPKPTKSSRAVSGQLQEASPNKGQ